MNVVELNALGGEDVNRHPAVMVVEINDGRPRSPWTGEEISVQGRTVLQGWGSLDGRAYVLSNGCVVPEHEWRWALK